MCDLELRDIISGLSLLGLVGIWLNIRTARRNQVAVTLSDIYDRMLNIRPECHELFSFPENHQSWSEEQKKIADTVSVTMELVSFLCSKKFVPPGILGDEFAGPIIKSWQRLNAWIKDYRESLGEEKELSNKGTQARKHFEIIASKLKKKYPNIRL